MSHGLQLQSLWINPCCSCKLSVLRPTAPRGIELSIKLSRVFRSLLPQSALPAAAAAAAAAAPAAAHAAGAAAAAVSDALSSPAFSAPPCRLSFSYSTCVLPAVSLRRAHWEDQSVHTNDDEAAVFGDRCG